MKKYFDYIIYFFLLLSPLIDALTGIMERFNFPISIGVLVRGLILVFSIVYLFLNKKDRYLIGLFIVYFLIECIYSFVYLDGSLFTEIKNIIVIFYLPLMILFFKFYKNEKINKELIITINFIYLFLIVLPFLFGLGFNTYTGEDGKSAFLGFFFDGNELSALLILLLPLSLDYLFKNKKYIHLIIYLFLYSISLIVIGTKVILLGTFIVLLYFGIRYLIKLERKKKIIFLVFFLIFIGVFITLLPMTPVYKNLIISLDYYGVDSFSSLFKLKAIDQIIFSNRLMFASNVFEAFSSNTLYIIFGIGRGLLLLIKDVEIDILDIFFSIGIFGSLIYIILINKNIFKLKGIYKFIFILLFIISLFSGHVLIKPMVETFIALLFILNNEYLDE